MSNFEQLRDVIAQTLDIDPGTVTEDSTSENLAGWDSLGHVNLMMALEQTFDIQLEVEDFPRLVSVKAILGYLRERADG